MSEIEQAKSRRYRFLKAVHDLAEGAPATEVRGEDVAERLGIDVEGQDFHKLAHYHVKAGNIEDLESNWGLLTLTVQGISEVERAMMPESRQERRNRFLRAVYDLSDSNPAEFVYWRDVAPKLGWDADNDAHLQEALGIAEYLKRSQLITIEVSEGVVYRITSKGIDEVEGNKQQESSGPSFVFNAPVHRSVVETHNTAELTNKELRKQFLRAAYHLGESRRGRIVGLNEIAEVMQDSMNVNDPSFVDKLTDTADYLYERGLIQKQTVGYGIISITAAGIDEVERNEPYTLPANTPVTPDEFSDAAAVGEAPVEIRDSLRRFERDHPNPARVAFIMMPFGETTAHDEITRTIKKVLAERGIKGIRADDKRYHDDLFPNVLTYMHGCGLGIAVFERLEADETNPNVALEVGYLFAMRKPVCLLKDRTLKTLQADLVGRLYDPFDPQDPAGTIPPAVQKWLSDKELPES